MIIINNKIITLLDFEKEVSFIKNILSLQGAQSVDESRIKNKATENLITENLIHSLAENNSIFVNSQEIDDAVATLRIAKDLYISVEDHKIGLLHCNSTYPAPVNELNLSAIKTLTEKYPDFEIGYSGHEMLLGTTVASVLLGASIIERHITLDRTMEGSDHSASVTPWGLFKLVSGIRELEAAYGDGVIKVTESEIPVRTKLRG